MSNVLKLQALFPLDFLAHECYTGVTLVWGRFHMPTAKKRINLTIDDELYSELEMIQDIRNAPSLSAVVIELAKEALEIQEDLYFAKIANERENEDTVSHDKIWK